MGRVMTVLGPIEGSRLGRTYPHEHLQFNLFRGFQPHREFLVNDPALVVSELLHFKEAGGTTIVEVTTPDMGRDPKALKEIAERSNVNVVMSTGRYREPFYEERLWRSTVNEIADELVLEIESGVEGIRPGIIGEIGTHEAHISPVEERVHRASARAHLRTGLPISLHANASPVGLRQLDLLEEEGVDRRSVVVGHCDTYPKLDYHLKILERGAWVQFDTIRGNFDYETEFQAGLVLELASRGHLGRILLSQDMASNRFFKAYGGRGFDFLLTEFVDVLLRRGLSQIEVDQLLIDNPRSFLTGAEE